MSKTKSTRSRTTHRAPSQQITVETARALLARIARLREQAEQLQSDLETLRDELPEDDTGPIDNRNYLAEVRQKVQTCLTDLEGPVSLLQPDEDDAECVLRNLEQLVGAERLTATNERGLTMDTPVNSAPTKAIYINSPLTLGSALTDLYQRARASLPAADLKQLAGLSEVAARLAHQMAVTCEGVGVLLAAERDETAEAPHTGALQSPHTLPELLFLLGSMADMIEHAVSVANDAAYSAQEKGGEA